MDARLTALQAWVTETLHDLNLGEPQGSLETVSGDASFRRYFRQLLTSQRRTYIAVDAPPEKEDSEPFVRIANHWHKQGVKVPKVIKADLQQGFMLLEDFGDALLQPLLEESIEQASDLYSSCMDSLIEIQQTDLPLPQYDAELLDREMRLFTEWYLPKHLEYKLSSQEQSMLDDTFAMLRETALGQIQAPVHRDYHSRNLMKLTSGDIGIIDFQDAVHGPLTYDLVSLLRDAYIDWPQEQVQSWAQDYFAKARQAGLVGAISDGQLMLWFDWMGLQRHIKVVGIFARLAYRDGKTRYLDDIPRTLNYIRQVSAEYDALTEFHQWLENQLMPVIESRA
ncbi:phosphotransferase [Bermanella marisrubri]|uniref:Predicted phosphotransferase n=1 Tax=Bermanella marisrubri TaxID=207949 RepID=Q1N3R5_9GAMM|nr:phosphotransferase [Bermanella marisrubri]EAT12809.1 predicted phosphotransferase [Oceanobacter sp. RED65] [Bermanella marisrubri]QIZ83132.1 phosphotransferase [Bermanella marisrubri]